MSTEQDTIFSVTERGRGRSPDGHTFSYAMFEASGNRWVRTFVEFRDSASDARKELRKRVNAASKVVELQDKGKKMRALIRTGKSPELSAILWTHGKELHSIDSPSLSDALEFEKNMGKTAKQDSPGPR